MKLYRLLPALVLAGSVLGFTACDEDPQLPPVIVPEATIEATTTIMDVKKTYNVAASVTNFIDTIGRLADGRHTIVKGRVVGNDVSGNISKYIMLQDSTAAMCFSIDAYDLHESYHVGQEVVVDLTDMYIGKYNRQYLMGYPEWYAAGNAWEAGRMPLELMKAHAQVNGLVELATVDTTAATISQIKAVTESDADGMLYWGARLVKFEDVRFEEGGLETFAPYHQNNVVRNLVDKQGNKFPTYNSGYADFYNDTIPAGYGTVVGILSYVGRDGWRLVLREKSDCVGFDPNAEAIKPVVTGDGTAEKPYDVASVLAKNPPSAEVVEADVWVEGYIVGWADLSTDYVVNAQTARFTTPATVSTNILVASNANETNVANCLSIQLPVGNVRNALNLVDNPGNLKKPVKLQGGIAQYSGVTGLRNVSAFVLDGVPGGTPGGDEPAGNVLLSAAFTDGQGQFTIENVKLPAALTAVWVQSSSYGMKATSYAANTNYDAESWLISPVVDFSSATAPKMVFEQALNFFTDIATAKTEATVWVRVEGGTWQALTVPTYPASLSWTFASTGEIDLSAVAGKKAQIGFKYVGTAAKAGTWEVKNLKVYAN